MVQESLFLFPITFSLLVGQEYGNSVCAEEAITVLNVAFITFKGKALLGRFFINQ